MAAESKSPLEVSFVRRDGMPQGVLVLGVWRNGSLSEPRYQKALDRTLKVAVQFQGKPGQVLDIPAPSDIPARRVVLVGLGEAEKADAALFRRAGGDAAAFLAKAGVEEAAVDLGQGPEYCTAFAYGARLRTHRLPDLKTIADPDEPPPFRRLHVAVETPDPANAVWSTLTATVEGVEHVRDLTHEPANRLTPEAFVAEARKLEELGVEVEALDRAALKREGLNLLLAVGRASINPPYLVVLRWRGSGDGSAPTLLVGKGVCFDTGGISIKPAAKMDEMKGDMAGAGAVLGTLHALARAKAPVNVTGILALAENMPGADAMRPGDVLRSHSGQTVEIIDTDAEGRLVLADALSYGCKHERPSRVVDLATLTGSIVTALGKHHGGLFTSDDALAAALLTASKTSGDVLWRMPLTDAVDDALKSEVADVKQCAAAGRLLPDALHAARFLARFVPDGIPYAHLDIAGVAERTEAEGYQPVGPTGFGVALLVDWLTGSPDHLNLTPDNRRQE